MSKSILHMSHWGAFDAISDGERILNTRPYDKDPEPSPILYNIPSSHHHRTRIDRPYVRSGWLENGPGSSSRRGKDKFVPLEWNDALDLLAEELKRIYSSFGAESVFGGSYGWASAGRFHHAQSQIHRFLNCMGGYVDGVDNYSFGASNVLLPHIIGSVNPTLTENPSLEAIANHSELVILFGGIATKNAANNAGGISRHNTRGWLKKAHNNGTRFILVSPLQDDIAEEANAEWIAPRPGSDTALMLALGYVLISEKLVSKEFLNKYCIGYEKLEKYILGNEDGIPKTPNWAETISEIPAPTIWKLARDMAAHRTLITVSWSLQRTQYGEQPLWMGIALASMLGQIGLPGGGFGHGFTGSFIGHNPRTMKVPALPQGKNNVNKYIPVARIADMLLNPGGSYHYKGKVLTYPDIKMVYWCGGNPFHHHQDLGRLRKAFNSLETVVVHDSFWTATTRHADFVLPATMSIERDDLGIGMGESELFAMKSITKPHGESKDDYEIFSELAHRLRIGKQFTEGRSVTDWLKCMYEKLRLDLSEMKIQAPSFQEFWDIGTYQLPTEDAPQSMLKKFRDDPTLHRLGTPSGKIEIFSSTIESFGYKDCAGHPKWLEPKEWLGSDITKHYPLHMIANQPKTRLHSQLDVGDYSQKSKISNREPLRMHPDDARKRNLSDKDVVEVFNDRGSCLAGLLISKSVRPGVVQLSTGAWYDPDENGMCKHGNPNSLTADRPTSNLSQAPTGQHALVEVRKYTKTLPKLTVMDPPSIVK
ncbi:biotin/methionine sulfoxide reductase [Alteribacillus persepolensis]|uniref:Biotin/methionine sulfoxide reductase n=1 Tax=Alteribacillus persepolensis TaxID=568899 RepID=A0A1G8EJF5_9BACI|nr:molybdopterin-dependent oxidoreductase [Alteribacillus persepolensis]SDH70054.1 biotin/methionine sulfoxide reductase [Alteribacillus persepolensis]